MGEALLFWRSESSIDHPNLQILAAQFPLSSAENAAKFGLPASGWTLLAAMGAEAHEARRDAQTATSSLLKKPWLWLI
jgi:hypothetical protein